MQEHFSEEQMAAFTEDMADEINYYFAKEVKKRQRTKWRELNI